MLLVQKQAHDDFSNKAIQAIKDNLTREKPSAQAYDIKSLNHYVFSKTALSQENKREVF